MIGDGVEKVCFNEPFDGGVLIDGGDGVSSVGEWIDVLHDGVEGLGLCTDAGDGIGCEGEGVLLYTCDGGDGVGDRVLSRRGCQVEVIDECEGDLLENLSHLAVWYLSLLRSNNS